MVDKSQSQLITLLSPPDLGDAALNQRANLLNNILLFLILGTAAFGIALIWVIPLSPIGLYLIFASLVIEIAAFALLRRGYLNLVRIGLVFLLWAILGLSVYYFEGIRGGAMLGQVLIIFLAGLLISEQIGVLLMVMTISLNYAAMMMEMESGLSSPWMGESLIAFWAIQSIFFLLAAGLMQLLVRGIRGALAEANRNARVLKIKVNELREAEKALHRSEARYQAILEDQVDMICRFLPTDGTITYANDAFRKFYELEPEEIGQASLWSLIPEHVAVSVKLKSGGLRSGNPVAVSEYKIYGQNGDTIWQEWIERGIFDQRGRLVEIQIVGRNVTEYVRLQKRLENSLTELESQAMTDALTGLLNRRAIMEHAEAEWHRAYREGSPLSLILMDVDDLKTINDSHGHLAGDRALQALAELMRNGMRKYDWLGRWGGDEFLLVLPGAAHKEAELVAERLRRIFDEGTLSLEGGAQVNLRVSLGVATRVEIDPETDSIQRLLEEADAALYQAKNESKILAQAKP